MTPEAFEKKHGWGVTDDIGEDTKHVLVYADGFYILEMAKGSYSLVIDRDYMESKSLHDLEDKLWDFAKYELGDTLRVAETLRANNDTAEYKLIVAIRQATEKEKAREGWGDFHNVTVIELDNGSLLYPSMDEEGNGPGSLFGCLNGRTVMLQGN